ncbi:ECF RNA polymerase sigma factor SigW [bacterium BMS3Abin02]|nr:ECF RNA polymerase sigma factor SigW [bacterium BMS3Abin02]GBE22336.1 ECF RNA polymerase sigma factor SigW [bacterium BMS3Bbin01]
MATALYDDPQWLGELFDRYEGRLFGCAHRMLAPGEVEDATQEIKERILKGLPRFRGDSAIGTWIFAVARNTCLDIRRRRKPPAYSSDVVLDSIPGTSRPADAFDTSILACRTSLAIHELPEGQAGVVVLRLDQGLSTTETATQLGITEDAVKARLHRARRRLRSALAQQIACPRCGPGTYAVTGSTVV